MEDKSLLQGKAQSKKVFCDAHTHTLSSKALLYAATATTLDEWEALSKAPIRTIGVHPQIFCSEYKNEVEKLLSFIKASLEKKELKVLGEVGADFFTKDFCATKREQLLVLDEELKLAQLYQVPIVVHCRKALNEIFLRTSVLKKLPAVIFHLWGGTFLEAQSLLRRGVNCYFSFGRPLLLGSNKAIECLKKLPLETILLETDSPFGKVAIEEVYDKAFLINTRLTHKVIKENFCKAFMVGCFAI